MYARNFLRFLVFSQFAVSIPLFAAESEEPKRRGIAAHVAPQALALKLDGRLDDAAWELAPVNTRFYQFQPEEGRDAPEHLRTTVRVLVDRDALVFGVRAWNGDPKTLN